MRIISYSGVRALDTERVVFYLMRTSLRIGFNVLCAELEEKVLEL